jgi:ABC-type uncharacterized transport system permease subunit
LTQPRWLNWAIPVISLVGALVVGAIVLLATGKNPLDVYWRILDRGFLSQRANTSRLHRFVCGRRLPPGRHQHRW